MTYILDVINLLDHKAPKLDNDKFLSESYSCKMWKGATKMTGFYHFCQRIIFVADRKDKKPVILVTLFRIIELNLWGVWGIIS